MPDVFLSYRRGRPDEVLAEQLHDYLRRRGIDVFLDRDDIPLGSDWDRALGSALDAAKFLVVLVSDRSAASDFVREEVRRAYTQKKTILSIRFGTPDLSPQLGAILNAIQGTLWDGQAPFEAICEQIYASLKACEGAPLPEAVMETGTISLDSPFYVRRQEDAVIERELSRSYGRTVVIKGPRQCGKSSLLVRAHAFAQTRSCRSWYLDFQRGLDASQLSSLELLLRNLAVRMQRAFNTSIRVEDVWDPAFGIKSSLEKFIEQGVLQPTTKTVFCFDEVDRVFSQDYHTDFFAAVRGWHNARAERSLWRNLTLVIAHSSDPSQWLADYYQSPFNIGDITAVLNDFDEKQTEWLNQAYGSPLLPAQVRRLLAFTGGHPYLTRLALYEMHSQGVTLEALQESTGDPDGPFGSHLRLQAATLNHKPTLRVAFRQILHTGCCEDNGAFEELYSAGLVSGSSLKHAGVRCQLYQQYFQERL